MRAKVRVKVRSWTAGTTFVHTVGLGLALGLELALGLGWVLGSGSRLG